MKDRCSPVFISRRNEPPFVQLLPVSARLLICGLTIFIDQIFMIKLQNFGPVIVDGIVVKSFVTVNRILTLLSGTAAAWSSSYCATESSLTAAPVTILRLSV